MSFPRRCLICSNLNPCAYHSEVTQEAELARNEEAIRALRRRIPAQVLGKVMGFYPPLMVDPMQNRTGHEARLFQSYCVQQKFVPDQTALVWRADLLGWQHELWRLRARSTSLRQRLDAASAELATMRSFAVLAMAVLEDWRVKLHKNPRWLWWTILRAEHERDQARTALRRLRDGAAIALTICPPGDVARFLEAIKTEAQAGMEPPPRPDVPAMATIKAEATEVLGAKEESARGRHGGEVWRAAWALCDDTEGTVHEDEFGPHYRVPKDAWDRLAAAIENSGGGE